MLQNNNHGNKSTTKTIAQTQTNAAATNRQQFSGPEPLTEDTSSDEEQLEQLTLTKKKQKHKQGKEKYPDRTPTNITTELKQSAILSTKDHGWNSTMGRRIHIPEPDEN